VRAVAKEIVMKTIILLATFFSSLTFAGERILLTGSSTVAPLVDELAKSFEKKHKGVRVDVQTGGSTRGIIDARRGTSDIGMISRSLKESEMDLKEFTIAIDGIGIILHRNNPISKLSKKQIVAIFKGELTNWAQLGGPDKRIVVVNKAQGRSTLELFLKYFKLKSSQVHSHIIIGDNEQGIKTVSAQPWSIGYVSIGTAEFNIAHKTPIKLLNMNGVSASVENVKNGSYPLSRKLNLVTSARPVGIIKKFLDFSRNQVDIIQGQYFVPAN
jgi:phosphate transport system substrate-binding protein